MINRIISNIKNRSNATLRSWSYQCESILAQRSRRFQQLFMFYHRFYGESGLKQIFRSYRKQIQVPLKGFMLSAVVGVTYNPTETSNPTVKAPTKFDWNRERLSMINCNKCIFDIQFLDTLPRNKLCPLCKEKKMKYCFCLLGNKKCKGPKTSQESIRNCYKSLNIPGPGGVDGVKVIEAAEESNWEPYISKNEFSIWRREERSSMYAYKVYARFDDISAADLLHVQIDLDYRKEWDETAKALELIEEDPIPGTNSHLIYWELKWPKLFSNRDYVYCRRYVMDEERKIIIILSRGTQHPKYPPKSSNIRVTDYWSYMVIKPDRSFHEPGVHYVLTYYDDPGLSIPQSIKSWVTQKQMPDFLKKLYFATKQYSCKRVSEMKQMCKLTNFNIMNNEYSANAERGNWLRRLWKQGENGK